jgi:putative flippase GtrA
MSNSTLAKKDYLIVSLIGLFFGLLLSPILSNIKLPFLELNAATIVLIVIGFVVFADFALWAASLVSRRIPIALQVAKFCAIGALNTLLDLGVLNILIFLTAIATGYWYSIFKGVSFLAAATNSYFLNRYWTFGMKEDANIREFGQFLAVSLIGFGLNVGVASLLVNAVGHPVSISPERWANIGALVATVCAMGWNFIGYKFIVFKGLPQKSEPLGE